MFHECDVECGEYKDKDHPIENRWNIDRWSFRRCPSVYVEEDTYMIMSLFNFMEKGITPNNVGCLGESNKYMQAMNYISCKIAEHKNKRKK